MRRDPAPGFSMLLFGVSLACYSPSLKSVQDQAYKAPVVVEGKVQGLAPAGGPGSNSTREPPASGRVALVKVLDKWPLRSGGLQREQVISVGSCAPLERNQRYIFFLEPTEQPLVFKTAFAPLDTNGKNLKKEVGKILCTDCGESPPLSLPEKGGRGEAVENGGGAGRCCRCPGRAEPDGWGWGRPWAGRRARVDEGFEIREKEDQAQSVCQGWGRAGGGAGLCPQGSAADVWHVGLESCHHSPVEAGKMEKSGGAGPRLRGSGVTLGGLARSAPTGLPWPGWQGPQEQLGRLPGCEGLRLEVLLGNDGPRPLLSLLASQVCLSTPLAQAELDFFCYCFLSPMWLTFFVFFFSIVIFSVVLPAQRVAQPSVNLQD